LCSATLLSTASLNAYQKTYAVGSFYAGRQIPTAKTLLLKAITFLNNVICMKIGLKWQKKMSRFDKIPLKDIQLYSDPSGTVENANLIHLQT
jgi:hypothetical protein